MKFMSILISKTILQWFNYNTSSSSFRKLCPLIEKEKCLLQPVGIVERNAKYHSSQKKTGLFIAQNVSKIINHKNVVVTPDLVEDRGMVEVIEALDLVEVQETGDQEKCLLQPVGIVEMNVKYHSSQKKTGLFIAQNVSKIINKISKLFFRNDENYQRMIYNGLQN